MQFSHLQKKPRNVCLTLFHSMFDVSLNTKNNHLCQDKEHLSLCPDGLEEASR